VTIILQIKKYFYDPAEGEEGMGSLRFLSYLCILLTLIPSHSWCSPRHKTKVGANHDWGLGLDKSSVNLDNKVSHDSDDEDPNVQNMLKENDSPAIRALMNDQLFLRHLELFLEKPNQKTFHELKNRAKTLRRRRTDAASTRFFLRD